MAKQMMKDPAVMAIQELGDSVATSFELLESDNRRLTERLGKLEKETQVGFQNHARLIETVRSGPQRAAPRGWRNPGRLDRDAARVWEWWRGRLLSGAGDERARETGHRLMEQALPGELAKVLEFHCAERAAFSSSDDIVPVTLAPIMDYVRSEPAYVEDMGLLVEMGSGSHKLPKEGTAPVAANYSENEAIAESANTADSTDLVATKGAKLRHFSIESVMDASPDLIAYWVLRIRNSVNELETLESLDGNDFTGVKTASSVNEVDLANGGAALADLDLLAEMVTAIPAAERDPARCAWFLSSDGLRALLQIQDAAGANPMLGQTPKELFGFPLIVTDQIATASGTPDTSTIYFGNWRGMAIGRRGMDLIDVVSYGVGSAFTAGQISVRVMRRYAVAVHLPSLLVRGINLRVAA